MKRALEPVVLHVRTYLGKVCGREGRELEAHGVGEGESLLPVVPPRGAQDGADLVELKKE